MRFFVLFFITLVGILVAFNPQHLTHVSLSNHTHKNILNTSVAEAVEDDNYDAYIHFFEEVFKKMEENYYQDVSRDDFERFKVKFRTKIYSQLKETGKSIDFVRWRSAVLLVDDLKAEEDVFSAFYPPKPAKEYQQTSLGKWIDLGIEGELIENGFQVTHVEPRSDAYQKGLRKLDLITQIDEKDILQFTIDEINELLTPLADSTTQITFLNKNKVLQDINVLSKEYFKQAVFNIPVPVDGIYCLQIQRFNRKTAEDIFRYMKFYREQGKINGLIIDLRDNPGGPPLAARELSSFFLEPGSDFAFFQKKNQPKAMLDVPTIPEDFRYSGPLVILINKKSGSASELFSGILQRRNRAVLMGTNSAGQVMLKSMFHFDDDSMVLLITSRGHHPDGKVFSFGGLDPDRALEGKEDEEILKYAALYLIYANKKNL